MKFINQALLATVLALPILPSTMDSASAQDPVIYDNGGPLNGGLGIVSDFTGGSTAVVADDFTLTPNLNVLTDYHWFGAYIGATGPSTPTDSFSIFIFDDLNGSPNNVMGVPIQFQAVDRQLTGDTLSTGESIYEYSVKPGSLIELTPGDTFWIGIFNEPSDGDWAWAQSSDSGNAVINFDALLANDQWMSLADLGAPSEMAFNLTGVPEPLTIGGILIASSFGAAFKRKLNGKNK